MAVTFTQTKALLQTMATTLSAEATTAGLTSLATGLTNLATEIGTANSSITEREFFGGGSTSFSATGGSGGATPSGGSASGSGSDNDSAAIVWSTILQSASSAIQAANSNKLRNTIDSGDSTKIHSTISEIASDLTAIRNYHQSIATDTSTVAAKQTTIADKQTLIEEYQKKMKELAEGAGLHVVGPYEYFTMISLYKLFVEEGKILDEPTIQKSATKEARARIEQYMKSIKDLPTMF